MIVNIMKKEETFFVPVPDHSSDTLLSVIKEWIHPATTIVSDCWKAYNCLEKEGFKHLTVNHTYNFVDPSAEAHTSDIEREWRDVRATVQKMGPKCTYESHFHRIMFFKRFKTIEERLHVFWTHVALFQNYCK